MLISHESRPGTRPPAPGGSVSPRHKLQWNRFTVPQLMTMALATIAPLVIVATIALAVVGVVSVDTMRTVSLGAGENPGMVTFGAMFLASPVQWWTGRSQVRVRKYLGIVFFLLALSNGAMFLVERGVGPGLGQPLVVAGLIAVALAAPLFATSSRWSQRTLGMRRWRSLHRLTYLVAIALVAHVVLVGDIGLGAPMIVAGFVARTRVARTWIEARGATR